MAVFTLDRRYIDAVLFDLDGVLTDSAVLHAQSWKILFDSFLEKNGGDHRPFDPGRDYDEFVDGKPRHDGIRSFLASRAIGLPDGEPDDPPSAMTVHGLGTRKNALFRQALEERGVRTFPKAVDFLRRAREAGFKTALVSSSRNSRAIVEKAGLADLFDAWIDGDDLQPRALRGKPAPDMFLAAASDLGVAPSRAVVIEDAIAGVEAGRLGRFGLVVGVDRTGCANSLTHTGADLVVSGLDELGTADAAAPIDRSALCEDGA